MKPQVLQRAVEHWKSARWWRKEARNSKTRREFLEASENLQSLSVDMLQRPHLYEIRDMTDWQIFQYFK